MVNEYLKPASVDEALRMKAERPGAAWLAGGTFLLAGYSRGYPATVGRLGAPGAPLDSRAAGSPHEPPTSVIDVGAVLPRSIERTGSTLAIGAGATFQELIESDVVPTQLKAAALSMANRNTRNRATVGGNLGANKSCASLVPLLLVLDAELEVARADGSRATMKAAEWPASPDGLVLSVTLSLPAGTLASSMRASRTACDVATSTAAVAYRLDGGIVKGLRVAMGGFGPHARLRPDLAALFEGRPLPSAADIEKAAAPLLGAVDDLRGSAAYKRLRGAALLADALLAAVPMGFTPSGSEAKA